MEVDGRCKFLKIIGVFCILFLNELALLVIRPFVVYEDCDDLYVSPMTKPGSFCRTKTLWNGSLNTCGQ